MKTIKPPRWDPVTKEYQYNGKWYTYFPVKQIIADEEALNQYQEQKQDERKDEGL